MGCVQTFGITGHQLKDLGLEQALLLFEFEKGRCVEVALDALHCNVFEEVLAASALRKSSTDVSHGSAQWRRNESIFPLPVLDDVLVISGKQLVAAVRRQRDLYIPGGEPGHHVGGNDRRVSKR